MGWERGCIIVPHGVPGHKCELHFFHNQVALKSMVKKGWGKEILREGSDHYLLISLRRFFVFPELEYVAN